MKQRLSVKRLHKSRLSRGLMLFLRLLLLVDISLTILMTLLTLLSTSVKDIYGLVDPMVKWIPRDFHWSNYSFAYEILGGTKTLLFSILLYLGVTAGQVISSMVIAYGFSRYKFPGRNIVFGLMIATFFIPQQVLMLPRYVLFSRNGLLGTVWTLILPSLTGQAMKQTILILVFWQFMKGIPISLEEAAMIDGASLPGIFVRIGVPLAAPGIVINSMLAFCWSWNDVYFSATYFKDKIRTTTIALSTMKEYLATQAGYYVRADSRQFHQGTEAAAAIIVILPLLILYLILEKRLIEGVDRAGITGE